MELYFGKKVNGRDLAHCLELTAAELGFDVGIYKQGYAPDPRDNTKLIPIEVHYRLRGQGWFGRIITTSITFLEKSEDSGVIKEKFYTGKDVTFEFSAPDSEVKSFSDTLYKHVYALPNTPT